MEEVADAAMEKTAFELRKHGRNNIQPESTFGRQKKAVDADVFFYQLLRVKVTDWWC
jgi:hypothetical protein